MAQGIARIRLDDGTPVWARVGDAEELGGGGGFQDTGVRDRVVSMAGGLTDVVRGVVGSLRAGLDPQGPVEVAVSFGIELTAQSGKVIGVLADGSGTASVNVSLTWTEPGPRPVPDAATALDATPAAHAAPAPDAAPAAGVTPAPGTAPPPGTATAPDPVSAVSTAPAPAPAYRPPAVPPVPASPPVPPTPPVPPARAPLPEGVAPPPGSGPHARVADDGAA
ncbi:CU044_2847 family protein [Streptomyces sp. NPDC093071]|uniref:CU044_2847 family protein n=1 Tax=Streptomyces sp. NPDC093071 TaxID=3366022 RepID=UPI0037F69A82